MTTSQFSPVLDKKIAEAIAECIHFLEIPSNALLLSAVKSLSDQISDHNRTLHHKKEQLWQEANAAVSRILLSTQDFDDRKNVDYFKAARAEEEGDRYDR